MAHSENTDPLIASGGSAKPYGDDTQIFVFGVHGTNNGPSDIAAATKTIANELSNATTGHVYHDSRFSWQGLNHALNSEKERMLASWNLKKHVLDTIDDNLRSGNLDRDKPLILNLAGFDQGSNVAIQAIEEITDGLRNRGLSAIHITTLSISDHAHQPLETPQSAVRQNKLSGAAFFAGTKLEMHAQQIEQALTNFNLNGKASEDVIAAVLQSCNKASFNPDLPINITKSIKNENMLIATQNNGHASLRANVVENDSPTQPAERTSGKNLS
jgi:hypothetical protein